MTESHTLTDTRQGTSILQLNATPRERGPVLVLHKSLSKCQRASLARRVAHFPPASLGARVRLRRTRERGMAKSDKTSEGGSRQDGGQPDTRRLAAMSRTFKSSVCESNVLVMTGAKQIRK